MRESFSWIKVIKYISKLPFASMIIQLQGRQHTWYAI